MMRPLGAATILVALAACSPSRRPAAAPQPPASAALAVADAELRAGCLDCLKAAYDRYEELRLAGRDDIAAAGAARAALLLAMRERELGMVDDGYLAKARMLAAGGALPSWLPRIADVVDALPGSRAGVPRSLAGEADLDRMRTLRQNRDAWIVFLRDAAHYDEAGAYAWLALTCDNLDARDISSAEILDAVSPFAGAPLIVYREALCRGTEAATLESLLAADPRFVEIGYSLGLADVASRPRPKLDEADRWFQRAHEWHPPWPALTLAMGGLAMTAEEFDRARMLYEQTLAFEPHAVDALLGEVRALTYLERRENAIAAADRLIAERWYVGDARYWRAFNELQLGRYDAAWSDIEDAEKILPNAEVPKLAGIISYRRQDLDTAVARFGTAQTRNPFDCETRFYLGVVHAEQRRWPQTADILAAAATCFQSAEKDLRDDIARISASDLPAERKARQIGRRERQIADGRRMIATSWFDIAVAYVGLARPDEAREFASRVSDDEQFGARARELLSRLREDNRR
jgi:tetratricopeptide (TPR) repeat protein